jgi:glutamyl-tRNA synthetase
VTATFHSQEYEEARKVKAPLIHWLPNTVDARCQVVMPDASIVEGFVEEDCKRLQVDTIVQFERFGFVRIDSNEEAMSGAYYCHR